MQKALFDIDDEGNMEPSDEFDYDGDVIQIKKN